MTLQVLRVDLRPLEDRIVVVFLSWIFDAIKDGYVSNKEGGVVMVFGDQVVPAFSIRL